MDTLTEAHDLWSLDEWLWDGEALTASPAGTGVGPAAPCAPADAADDGALLEQAFQQFSEHVEQPSRKRKVSPAASDSVAAAPMSTMSTSACQVGGCGAPLEANHYARRVRLCAAHMVALSFEAADGSLARLCQRCHAARCPGAV